MKLSKEENKILKLQRRLDKIRTKEKKVSIPKLKKELRKWLHRYIRTKWIVDGWGECISCKKRFPASVLQAGHYLKDGNYPRTRYEEDNIWKQCQSCNLYKGGNLTEYRINLVEKIGESRVKELETMRHEYFKKDREWYEEKINTYKVKVSSIYEKFK